jgi:hypothetical protein
MTPIEFVFLEFKLSYNFYLKCDFFFTPLEMEKKKKKKKKKKKNQRSLEFFSGKRNLGILHEDGLAIKYLEYH